MFEIIIINNVHVFYTCVLCMFTLSQSCTCVHGGGGRGGLNAYFWYVDYGLLNVSRFGLLNVSEYIQGVHVGGGSWD